MLHMHPFVIQRPQVPHGRSSRLSIPEVRLPYTNAPTSAHKEKLSSRLHRGGRKLIREVTFRSVRTQLRWLPEFPLAAVRTSGQGGEMKALLLLFAFAFVSCAPRQPKPLKPTTEFPRWYTDAVKRRPAQAVRTEPLACAIARFHALTNHVPATYHLFAPTDGRAHTLEFQRNVDALTRGLERRQLTRVPDTVPADLLIVASFTNTVQSITDTAPVYGTIGGDTIRYSGSQFYPGGTVFSGGTIRVPQRQAVVGLKQQERVVHVWYLGVSIYDAAKLRAGAVAQLYSGQITAAGQPRNRATVFPALVSELFADFPGPSSHDTDKTIYVPDE
jgi:hypothetical protein